MTDPDQLIQLVGRRFAALRELRGLTQEQLAEEAGVTLKYVQRLERGENLSLRSLAWWSSFFDVEVIAFFRGRISPNRPPGRPKRKDRARR